jgi:hypothetical protein
VPPDGRPKDIHNPLTLMSADMPTLMYDRFYTADRSRINMQRLNATYAARTAALVPFTEVVGGGGATRTSINHSKANPIALKENVRAKTILPAMSSGSGERRVRR